jgi:chitin disaccharide deacetylase
LKGHILAMTGGKALSADLKRLSISHYPCFSGVYDFAEPIDYRALFKQWLVLVPSNTLIMCHPGEGGQYADVLAHSRMKELAYFLSDEFVMDCQEQGVCLI